MTIAADPPSADSVHRRRQSRLARQARVGILRNPNEPPRPPPRKASLTGRWLSLRSSRRPPAQEVVEAALAVTNPPDGGTDAADLPRAALRHDDQGRLAGIDVAGLMASVEGLGTAKPLRTPYGAGIRPDMAPVNSATPRPRARPRPAEDPDPVADAPDPPPPPSTEAPPPRRKRGRLWPLVGGVVVALITLVLLPAVLSL